ncbi:glycoprotein 3-alpha-L-fucosyltransferase A-like [Ruditapes philippinarum]|uniref:glycoprotein 3-alpha-L-fucosyltransferase A-like n=1 Tax=Ruditapes philippinarum TaxID=129788 RepID=UPI00295B1333|nr:glycoprotein 3-alpha-L-fucosyltransferase A-like [Ruditapes philippinarum]XP_060551987.1 glycoprotein 3-alpha-L-fucosyltransferase A-like [Ruditapes philippinarum]
MGFNKMQKQFIFLIGIFVFLTLLLNMIPLYHENKLLNSMSVPFNVVRQNHTYLTRSVVKKAGRDIWKIIPGQDSIVEQVAFNPKINPDLPPKKILMWNGVSGWGQKEGKASFHEHNCNVKNCEFVSSPKPNEIYDARMFKEIDLNSLMVTSMFQDTVRTPEQVWIMFALESPEASPNYEGLNNVINWTATYRHQSTIVTPYDKWVPFDNASTILAHTKPNDYAKGKTKLGAIFVSNCDASNNRLQYLRELKKYMTVDIYGYCGDKECTKTSQNSCFEMLKKDYKFYFAFENANCRDYITEKFFMNALRHDVLPVVMGAHPDDYKRMAPPGSYIHVEDFKGPEELANYLLKLAADDTEYNKYFRWKETGSFIDTKFWCRICSMLWDPNRPRLSVSNLNEWWRGDGTCIGTRRWDSVGNT